MKPSGKKKKQIKKVAKVSAKKAKDTVLFIYKHREEIMEVIALLGSLIAIGKTTAKRRKR